MGTDLTDIKTCDTTKLAYIGDAVYELFVRGKAVELSGNKAKDMSRFSVGYVKADSQALACKVLIERSKEDGEADGFKLTPDELSLVKRARNRTNTTAPRGSSEQAYKLATGLEALAGWLYLRGDNVRLRGLMDEVIKVIDDDHN